MGTFFDKFYNNLQEREIARSQPQLNVFLGSLPKKKIIIIIITITTTTITTPMPTTTTIKEERISESQPR